jgi:Double zinc ribbon
MPTAIFGITNNGLNLAATLFVLMLVVVWLSLIVYTYLDARRRVSDPFLVGCATIASFIPYLGTAVYAILRPPEFLEDAHERELEIRAAELRVRQLTEQSCPNCEYPVEKNYLRCPNCQHRLKDPCPTCGKPVDPRWTLCPYCETELTPRRRSRQSEEARSEGERARPRRSAPPPEPRRSAPPPESRRSAPPEGEAPAGERAVPKRRKKAPASASTQEPATRAAPKEATSAKQPKRSASREPDSDPRQA